jgi:hypothetical protein
MMKLHAKNLVHQLLHFCVQNSLKLTYRHQRFQKIFRGLYPPNPRFRGEGRVGKGGEGGDGGVGRGGVGRGWGLGPPNLDEGLTPMNLWKGMGSLFGNSCC